MKIMRLFVLVVGFIFSTFSLAMDEDLQQMFSKKHVITQENFDKAMKIVHDRPAGEYVAEKLGNRLNKFVGQELSADEWAGEVQDAYIDFIESMGFQGRFILINHPVEAIVMATIWAIPNE